MVQERTNFTSIIRSVFDSEVARLVAIIIVVIGFVNYVILPINEMQYDITYIKTELANYVAAQEKMVALRDAEQKAQDQRLINLERRMDVVVDRLELPANE